MRIVKSTRVLWPLAVGALLFALPLASADHGPLPGAEPTLDAVAATEQNTFASLDLFMDYGDYTQGQILEGTQEVQEGLEGDDLVLPVDQVDNIVDQGFKSAESFIDLAGASASAIVQASDEQEAEVERFKGIMSTTLANALGVDPENPHQVLTESTRPCVGDLHQALADAEPGEEILVCAGTYEGPIRVRQNFVTVIAEQGPSATRVDARGDHGFIVEGTGVTISGFRVTGAVGEDSAGVFVGSPDGSHAGVTDIAGTTIIGNEFRYNAHGMIAKNAPGTVIALNTFWGSKLTQSGAGGVGVLVTAAAGTGMGLAEAADEGYGTLVVANNFQYNVRHAITSIPASQERPSAPTLAIFNHHNSPLGPNVQLVDACHGPEAPGGDPYCRDGIGHGVVVVGFSPVPL